MRILHCIPNLSGGGAERQLCYLAAGLSERGHDVHVICVPEGPNVSLLDNTGCSIHVLAQKNSYDLAAAKQVYSVISALKPDIVQSWLLQMDVIAAVCARLLGTPHVLSERSVAGAYPSNMKTFARVLAGRIATAIVANSDEGLAYWSGHNNSIFNRVIRNGVRSSDYSSDMPGAERLPSHHEQPDIIYVGRYHADKNIMRSGVAVTEVLRSNAAYIAAFFGEGPLQGQLETWIENAGIKDRFRLAGYDDDVRATMRGAKVFVNVSHIEGNPNAVLEAALEGVPLVLSDIPSHRGLFSGEHAILVDPRDEASIAAGISECLLHPAAARLRAVKARTIVTGYTVDKMVTNYERMYREILDCRRGTHGRAGQVHAAETSRALL